jgi:hypothetical protein
MQYPPSGAWRGTPSPWDKGRVLVIDSTPTPSAPSGDDYRAAVAVHKDVSRTFERFGDHEAAARHRDRMHACKDRAINACCSLCDPRCESWHTTHEAATGWLYEPRLTVHGTEP